jgi:C_GCAxxG_C_C family probable redox protein
MLRDRIEPYYLGKDFNCAESLLHAANDEYDLGIPEEAFKLVGGFGAGFGCGSTCGVLSAGVSAIGMLKITGRAHATEGLRELCTAYVNAFKDKLGSIECDPLVAKYKKPETRCLETVLLAADTLERVLAEAGFSPKAKASS